MENLYFLTVERVQPVNYCAVGNTSEREKVRIAMKASALEANDFVNFWSISRQYLSATPTLIITLEFVDFSLNEQRQSGT